MFRSLFPSSPPASVVVVDAEEFGPRMSQTELLRVVKSSNIDAIRAFAQMILCHRNKCQRAVEDKSNTLNNQTSFEAGAAAGLTDLLLTLRQLLKGQVDESVLDSWFTKP